MGCDYYADENGVFEIQIYDYESEKRFIPKTILIDGLKPRHKIGYDILKGDVR